MSLANFFRNTTALSIAAGLFAFSAASSHAQSTDDMARCSDLYGLYTKYEGTSRMGAASNSNVAAAYTECQKGNYAWGIATLTKALERQGVSVPAVEAAKAH